MSMIVTAGFATDAQRWSAVVERDARADGSFVYAVRTTGVYCRPSCSSRRPRRENVRFFDDGRAAERAGFRACRRCGQKAGERGAAALIARACRRIEESEGAPPLSELAGAAGLSPSYFHRLFKRVVGVTPRGYAMTLKTRRLRENLGRGESVTRAIAGSGFGSSSRAYEAAEGNLGMTPSAYRAGGPSQRIGYAMARSSLGWVLVAATERGVCAIQMGDEPKVLVEELHRRFPRAESISEASDLAKWLKPIVAAVDRPGPLPDVPLDIRGTAFQRRVWEELRAIPAGTTATYTEVAARIGRPKAVRAVAGACAANPVAIAVPCHRVVREDGGLGGYRWGIERKQALLEGEEAKPGAAQRNGRTTGGR